MSLIAQILLLTLFSGNARAELSCQAQYRELDELVDKSFKTGTHPKLPEQLEISVSRKEGDAYLKTTGKLWTDYWPDKQLMRDLDAARKAGSVPADVMARLKTARARLKVIRFLCEATCEDHEAPKHLDQLVKSLGHVEEIQSFGGDASKVSKSLKTVLDALDDKPMGKVMDEIAGMSSASRHGNQNWLEDSLKLIEKSMDRKDLSPEEYHEVRKTLGRIQTLVMMDAVKSEDPKKMAAFEWLRDLYNKIGLEHDDMVKAEFDDVEIDETQFKPELRKALKQVVDAVH